MADIHHHQWRDADSAPTAGLHLRWDRIAIVAACLAIHAAWISAIFALAR